MEGAVLSRGRVGLYGSIRKLLAPLQQPMSADSCCKRGCELGMYAEARFGAGRQDWPTAYALESFRFVAAALAAYKKLPSSNTSSLPTAVLLPCTHFVSGLAAGEVTDHDLRLSLLGSGDADGRSDRCALVRFQLFAPCSVRRNRRWAVQGGPSAAG